MGSEQSTNKENRQDNKQYGTQRQRQYTQETTGIHERHRNPYSYAQSDLQNFSDRRPETLYPNLQATNNAYNNRNHVSENTEYVYVTRQSYPSQRVVPPIPPRVGTPTRPFTPSTPRECTQTPTFPPVAPRASTPASTFTPVTQRESTPSRAFTPSAPPSAPTAASRSASRDRTKGNNAYNCPTCNKRFGVEIFSCPSGHSSCKDCRDRGAACGMCGHAITNTRNFAMQDFIAQIRVPCPNAGDGCTLQIKTIDLDTHAAECPFAEMACPVTTYTQCRWRGKSSQMVAHFNDVHPAESQGDVDTELILPNICYDTHNLYLVPMNTYYFIFHIKVDSTQRCIYMTTQLLGTHMSAAKWNYEVHVYNKREPRRKYFYVAPCTAASTPVREIFNKAECATIPLQYALTFVNDGVLTYKFFIKRVNDNSSHSAYSENNGEKIYNKRNNFRGRGRGRGFHHRGANNSNN